MIDVQTEPAARKFPPPPAITLGCEACPVRGDCKRLANGLRKLMATPVLNVRGSAESAYRSFLFLQESVDQRGLRYPHTKDFRSCWFHDKPGLLGLLRERAEELLARAGFAN